MFVYRIFPIARLFDTSKWNFFTVTAGLKSGYRQTLDEFNALTGRLTQRSCEVMNEWGSIGGIMMIASAASSPINLGLQRCLTLPPNVFPSGLLKGKHYTSICFSKRIGSLNRLICILQVIYSNKYWPEYLISWPKWSSFASASSWRTR
jgi:hypothetical protein